MAVDPSQDIRNRAFTLACDVVRFGAQLPTAPANRRIADQLIRAATSVGANLEEAKAASSRREFIHCVQISLKESRETMYWLRICAELQLGPSKPLAGLLEEANHVSRILGAIVVNAKQRLSVD